MVATIILRSETQGVRPEFDYEVESQRDAVQTPDDSPQVRAREKNERQRRHMRLAWSEANEGLRQSLELAYKAALGPVSPMLYTPLGDVDANALEVHFVEDTLEITKTSAAFYRMTVEIEEGR